MIFKIIAGEQFTHHNYFHIFVKINELKNQSFKISSEWASEN